MNKKTWAYILFFSLIIIITGTLFVFITKNGIGISPDSIKYVELANNIINKKGFLVNEEPFTHFPPTYPLMLAIAGLIHSDIVSSARWMHALLFCLNTILFGIIIYLGTKRNITALILGFLVFISSREILTIHSYAWSESPFITFSLISLLLLAIYNSSKNNTILILSSISLGIAVASRYIGIAFIPPFISVLYILIEQPKKQKILTIIMHTILTITPIFLWIIRNYFIAQSPSDRLFIFHLITINKITNMINTLHYFILPKINITYLNALELLIIILILAYMTISVYKSNAITKNFDSNTYVFIIFGTVFSFFYIIVLITSISFFDAYTPTDYRIMSPVFVFFTISVFCLVFEYSEALNKKEIWLLFICCIIFSFRSTSLIKTINSAQKYNKEGIGLNTVNWNNSPTVKRLKLLDANITKYSNGRDIIYIKTGMSANYLPKKYDSKTTQKNKDFDKEIKVMCYEVGNGDAIIVYFNELAWRSQLPSLKELNGLCDLPILYETNDGTIYGFQDNNNH